MTRLRAISLLALLLLLLVPACASRSAEDGEMAGVAPMLSVERFLQATNARDLDAMARIFGTVDGSASATGSTLGCAFKKFGDWIGLGERCTTKEAVEIRMDVIADILEHEDYEIVSERRVPGRSHPATRIGVDLRIDGDTFADVPFVVVRTDAGRWMVEQIGLERITQR